MLSLRKSKEELRTHVSNICLYNNHSKHLYMCQEYLTLQSDYHILKVSRAFDKNCIVIVLNFYIGG